MDFDNSNSELFCPAPRKGRMTETDRRSFLKACAVGAAAAGISPQLAARVAESVASPERPTVVWMHYQECTGCTETLLRSTQPGVAELILDLISLDYHETLAAAAGHQLEQNLDRVLEEQAGNYLLVVEGAVPVKDGGVYCKVAGHTAVDSLQRAAAGAAAIVAMGSCASFGGLAAAPPNPTGATGIPVLLPDKAVITLPGCPPSPYHLLGTLLYYLSWGKLPELDAKGRPRFAYGTTIHEHCPRRPHFDAGRFAKAFGDDSHRAGHCLYELGCKGPQTYASCSTQHFCDVVGAWPIGIGHPCVGCSEEEIAFKVPMHETIDVPEPTPAAFTAPMTPTNRERSGISPLATGLAGLVGGVLVGAAWMASRRLDRLDPGEDQKLEV